MATDEVEARQKLAEFLTLAGRDPNWQLADQATLMAVDSDLGIYKFALGNSEHAVVGNTTIPQSLTPTLAFEVLQLTAAHYFTLGSEAHRDDVYARMSRGEKLPYGQAFTAVGGYNFRCVISLTGDVALFSLLR